VIYGFDCTKNSANLSICTPKCGDNHLAEGEVCDDGNKNDLIGCNSDCTDF